MAPARPQIFTIPSGFPFARALAAGVIARTGSDPLRLADALVLVPTRRAARALRDAFAEALGGAALLPRIRALGDVDDEDGLFDPSPDELDLVPPVAPLRRRLLLAMLVQRWSVAKAAPLPFTQALSYAGELARFLDETVTQGVDLARLKTLTPDDMAVHWQEVVKFLAIIAEQWPNQLKAEGAAEPASHRDAKLRALAAELAAHPPRAPVIAAGSTGSIPATAELLKTIAHLPTGAVVLPGLDTDLDGPSWTALDAAHAQFGLSQLLAHIGVDREDVALWSPLPESYANRPHRVRFLSEALRPPPTTDAWHDLMETGGDVAAGSKILRSSKRRTRARKRSSSPARCARCWRQKTAPPHSSRRIAALPAGSRPSSRAGTSPSMIPPGATVAHAAGRVPCAAGARRGDALRARTAARAAETSAGGRVARSAANSAAMCAHWSWRRCAGLGPSRGWKASPPASRRTTRPSRFRTGSRNWRMAAAIRRNDRRKRSDAGRPGARAWRGGRSAGGNRHRAGSERAVARAGRRSRRGAYRFARPRRRGHRARPARHYAESFRALAEMRAVRPLYNLHPRLAILGPLEARLLDFDLVILSGLNEGQWPAEAATDPWLSRPMREKLGLEAPERRTGLAAHDFASLAASRGSADALAERERRADGRFALAASHQAIGQGLGRESALAARNDLLEWARALDEAPREKRAPRPAPRPPAAARPRTLSITEIETWLRDPYAIYAKHILHLRPLDGIDSEPGPRERGIAIHGALERFLKTFPNALPPDAFAQLLRFGEEAFTKAGATAAILALWRPAFRARRALVSRLRSRTKAAYREKPRRSERHARYSGGEKFTLRGRADRIDVFADGAASIIDYKTGRVPTHKQINALHAPNCRWKRPCCCAEASRNTAPAQFLSLSMSGLPVASRQAKTLSPT